MAVDFRDEAGVLEPLDGFVQGAGPEPHTTFGVTFHLLLDAVAVTIPIGQRQQDVEVNDRGRADRCCHIVFRYIGER